MKNILFAFFILLLASCNTEKSGDSMTPSGYKYTHIKTSGEKINEGDYVYFTLKVIGDNGKVLQEIAEGANMPVLQIPTADNPLPESNAVIEMLSTANVGDSLTMVMPLDSIANSRQNPQLAGMEYLQYVVYVADKNDETGHKARLEEVRLEMEAKKEELKKRIPEVDELLKQNIADYKSGKLKLETTPEGLKYIIHNPGTGMQAKKGMRASVQYYGTLLDGTMFDNSFRRGAPFQFTIGRGEAIKGWDLGIPLLKTGGSATLILPYDLAYGEAGNPPMIPAKSELAFYVELEEVN